MPYTREQAGAIASKMRKQGKSPAEIRAFFHKHSQAKTAHKWGTGKGKFKPAPRDQASASVRG